MCEQNTESVKVAPESVLSNRGNLEGTHFTRFSAGRRVISEGFISRGLSPYTNIYIYIYMSGL